MSKVDAIIEGKNLSGSQIDRLSDKEELLMNYLSAHIQSVQDSDPLIQKIKDHFTADFDNLSDGIKLRILELLLKKETEDHTPLINLFAKAIENKKKPDEGNTPQGNQPTQGSGISQEDISSAKDASKKIDRVLAIVEKLEKSEFNENE